MNGRYRGRVLIRVLNPEVKAGGLKADAIKKALKKRRKHLEQCYRAALGQNPTIGGTMMIALHIKDGRVNVGSMAGIDPAVASCARYQVQMLALPPSAPGETTIAMVGVLFSTD